MLRADRRTLLRRQEELTPPLLEHETELRIAADERFDVVAGAQDAPAVVFSTRSRLDALRVDLLLKLLRHDCGAAPAAGRRTPPSYNPAG
ncbi:hypothetical protein CLD22_02450 [Rubrivivax gelatinosus]|nr:hypothetical protein [Rubrivivax gelatinosus]